MRLNHRIIKTENVDQNLLNSFLEPYKENCKYLKKAQFQYSYPRNLIGGNLITSDLLTQKLGLNLKFKPQGIWYIKGDFAIPDSCYIADTGHFNAVEFNICYNQLMYVMIAHWLQRQLFETMNNWDLATFKEYQLSNFLIVRLNSNFKKPINAKKFQGTISLDKYSSRGNLILLKTSCTFTDDNDGWADGEVKIAILNDLAKQQNGSSQTSNKIPV